MFFLSPRSVSEIGAATLQSWTTRPEGPSQAHSPVPSQLQTRPQRLRGVKQLSCGHQAHYWKTRVFPKPIPAGACPLSAFADLERCQEPLSVAGFRRDSLHDQSPICHELPGPLSGIFHGLPVWPEAVSSRSGDASWRTPQLFALHITDRVGGPTSASSIHLPPGL